jgi:hypothetical protein
LVERLFEAGAPRVITTDPNSRNEMGFNSLKLSLGQPEFDQTSAGPPAALNHAVTLD